MHRSIRALLPIGALALAACAGPAALPQHPLAGRIWDVAQHRFIGLGEAERRIAAADVALLGETHDNPIHHEIQLRLLRADASAGRRPALAMEQLDADRQADVDAAIARGVTAHGVLVAARASSGWDWTHYAPLISFALTLRLPVVGLGVSRHGAQPILEKGLSALGPDERERLALARTWNPERERAMRHAIVEGHCGQTSPLDDRLVDVQRMRDAVMADRILAHAGGGVVAILGRGHARADLGVPLYLAARSRGVRVISVGLVETDADIAFPARYPEAAPGRYDLLWFTPEARRADSADSCAAFRGAKLPAG